MVSLNYNGIKNTLASFNLFNISINRNVNNKKFDKEDEHKHFEIKEPSGFKDHKTTLCGRDIDLIKKINDHIIVYLFIQKEKDSSAWNLVAPVIMEKSTGKISQYGLGYFALEGRGGGLKNTDMIMYYLKKHSEKGFKVSILPKVVDNKLLSDFEYIDSGIKLIDLIENSIDLINYRKDSFEWIYKQYMDLVVENGLES